MSHSTHSTLPKELCKPAELRCSLSVADGGAGHRTELGLSMSHSSAWEAPAARLNGAGFAPLSTSAPGAPQQTQIETGGNLLLPLRVSPPPLFPGSINKVAVQMENCKKTCLQWLVKPEPRGLLQPCLVWGSSRLQCHRCACKEHAHGCSIWTEGLPYPLTWNRAGGERACFQKCGLFPVCRIAGTSKLRHLCAWPGVPAQDPHEPQGHQQDTLETATLSLVQVLCGTAAKSWLPCTARLVCDAAPKMPCQVRQLVSPLPHSLFLPSFWFVSLL